MTETILFLDYEQPISASSISLSFGANADSPELVSILQKTQGSDEYSVVVYRKNFNKFIQFPSTNASDFKIIFYHAQPLNITEISMNVKNLQRSHFLRFLAQPSQSYTVYSEPSNPNLVKNILAPRLNDAPRDEVITFNPPKVGNSSFKQLDTDEDGIPDSQDNCRNVSNPDQNDQNNNNTGDACEDFDFDGIINSKDNCPNKPNDLQQDEDSDGIGDHCDNEESRWIEKFPLLPWAGIAFSFVIILLLFKSTMAASEEPKDSSASETEEVKDPTNLS